jgi:hypothetical protein
LGGLWAHNFSRAYEQTAKNQLVGRNSNEFEQIAKRQFCVTRLAGMAPFQFNGNRLRRRMYGLEVETPQLQRRVRWWLFVSRNASSQAW